MADMEAGGKRQKPGFRCRLWAGINPGPAETKGGGDSWETDLGASHPWGKKRNKLKDTSGLVSIADPSVGRYARNQPLHFTLEGIKTKQNYTRDLKDLFEGQGAFMEIPGGDVGQGCSPPESNAVSHSGHPPCVENLVLKEPPSPIFIH